MFDPRYLLFIIIPFSCLILMFAICQARQMFDNLKALLKVMDIDMTRGVKATLYVTNLDYAKVALKVCVEEF